MDPADKHCRKCGSPDHEFKDCSKKTSTNPYKPLYERFKPEQYRLSRPRMSINTQNNMSYAQATYSRLPTNNKSPSNNDQNRTMSPSGNDEAILKLQKRVKDLKQQFKVLSEVFKDIKEEVMQQKHNQSDIDY